MGHLAALLFSGKKGKELDLAEAYSILETTFQCLKAMKISSYYSGPQLIDYIRKELIGMQKKSLCISMGLKSHQPTRQNQCKINN